MRITPQKIDFHFGEKNKIADRIEYALKDGKWDKYRITA